jgi:tight adherence protein B
MLPIVLLTILGFVVIASLGFVFAGGDGSSGRTARRTHAIVDRGRPDKPRTGSRAAANDPGQRRKQIIRSLKDQDRQQRKQLMAVTSRLQQAGLGADVKPFWIVSGVLGALGLLIPLLLRASPLIGLGAGLVLGLGLPRWVISTLAKRRSAKFSSYFADAIDIIVRGVKSGLPLHDCLKIIARESPDPLGPEFKRLVDEIGMGVSIDTALEKMYERMPTSELRFFTIVLNIQQKTGGNLAEALGNLSNVLRGRKMMREKIKALSAEAIASAGIIGSLPPGVGIMITLTSPAYMSMMITDKRGHMLLLIAAGMMAFGIWVMRRMINFKI